MAFFLLSSAVVLLALVWWWAGRFPCSWDVLRAARGAEGRETRQRLRTAWDELREGRRKSAQITEEARAQVEKAKADADNGLRPWDERFQNLSTEREARLKQAGECGDPVGAPLERSEQHLERLQLHQHALLPWKTVTSEEGEVREEDGEPLALYGLRVEIDSLSHHLVLRVTLPRDRNPVREWLYPNEKHWEAALHAFVVKVRDQQERDEVFREELRSRVAGIDDEMRQVETRRAKVAEENGRMIADADANLRSASDRAAAVLEKAYDAWEKEAHRRPRR
ncbi:hypothetical protein [Streptomyces sp. NBC_01451]|uniref:hypothetical protein n=1 Tax=Streptomyces sp. NBC_01451 TaxID=2903872 RepID=UPI002E35311D|nr:hypothetical protein [Streptomyces sp. NBC_01451]